MNSFTLHWMTGGAWHVVRDTRSVRDATLKMFHVTATSMWVCVMTGHVCHRQLYSGAATTALHKYELPETYAAEHLHPLSDQY